MPAEQDTADTMEQLSGRVRIALLESPSQVDPLTIARIREIQMVANAWSKLLSQQSKHNTSTDK